MQGSQENDPVDKEKNFFRNIHCIVIKIGNKRNREIEINMRENTFNNCQSLTKLC